MSFFLQNQSLAFRRFIEDLTEPPRCNVFRNGDLAESTEAIEVFQDGEPSGHWVFEAAWSSYDVGDWVEVHIDAPEINLGLFMYSGSVIPDIASSAQNAAILGSLAGSHVSVISPVSGANITLPQNSGGELSLPHYARDLAGETLRLVAYSVNGEDATHAESVFEIDSVTGGDGMSTVAYTNVHTAEANRGLRYSLWRDPDNPTGGEVITEGAFIITPSATEHVEVVA